MLTPDEIDARRAFLEFMSRDGQALNTNAPHASVNNRRWFRTVHGRLEPTPERAELHEDILVRWEQSNPHVVRERSAILMAGPPGAGKSSTHTDLFRGRDRRQWREVDADDFKRYLLKAAIADGTLQDLLPEHLRVGPGEESIFYANELAALVHHESTNFLFNPAQEDAIARGDNLVLDGTLAWKDHADKMVASLSEYGYTIQVVDVEAPKDVAAARIVKRWREGYIEAMNAPADPSKQLGGRWVPPTALDPIYEKVRASDGKPLHGKSVTEVNALEVSESNSTVTRYDLYRTATVDSAAEHVERRDRSPATGDLTVTWTAGTSPTPAAAAEPPTVSGSNPARAAGHPHSLQQMLGNMSKRRPGPTTSRGTEPDTASRDAGPELG